MTPAEQKQIDAVEADRRRRERLLLLLLLGISTKARRYAAHALQLGHDALAAIAAVWLGDDRLNLPGISGAWGEVLTDSHVDGYKRAAGFGGARVPPVDAQRVREAVAPTYAGSARRAAGQMLDTLKARVGGALADAGGETLNRQVGALRDAFGGGGYSSPKPWALVNAATGTVVDAYAGGMKDSYDAVGGQLLLKHHTITDGHETEICRVRDGLVLPASHPYWLSNTPQLHYGCRSIVLQAEPEDEVSDWLPTIPPATGFGAATTSDLLAV